VTTVEDDSREFRLALLNELVDSEGRTGPGAAAPPPGPDRFRVLFFGAAATAGILALTLILVLVTGGGSGSKKEEETSTTTSTTVTVATTPGFVTTSVNVIDTRVIAGVGPNSRVDFTKGDGSLVAANVLVVSVRRTTELGVGNTALDINVSNEDLVKIRAVPTRELYVNTGGTAATTTSAPPATAPGGTTTPSS
jgi:hypothetical protein